MYFYWYFSMLEIHSEVLAMLFMPAERLNNSRSLNFDPAFDNLVTNSTSLPLIFPGIELFTFRLDHLGLIQKIWCSSLILFICFHHLYRCPFFTAPLFFSAPVFYFSVRKIMRRRQESQIILLSQKKGL